MIGVAQYKNIEIPEPAKAGETSTAGARVAASPDKRAPVEPVAEEVGCGQAPETNSDSATPGVSLLFCSLAQIEAAPAEERAAYYRIVDSIVADPEAYGLQRVGAADASHDNAVDAGLIGLNNDWVGR